jgi:hypothetical protein
MELQKNQVSSAFTEIAENHLFLVLSHCVHLIEFTLTVQVSSFSRTHSSVLVPCFVTNRLRSHE